MIDTAPPGEPWVASLPADVADAFDRYPTCAFSTVAPDGTPITWPTVPLFQPDEGRFVIGSAIGLGRKVRNVRRDPRVALLFSNRTGTTGLLPTILVQGLATSPEDLFVSGPLVRAYWRNVYRFQHLPLGPSVLLRRLAWYHIRLFIFVQPSRILWWDASDAEHDVVVSEVDRVG